MGVYVIMSGVEHTRKPFKYQALMGEMPYRAGVYVLFCDEEVIYIGNGLDVRQRLLSHHSSNDPCIKLATDYWIEHNRHHKTRWKQLLRAYRNEHGDLPRCNQPHQLSR